MTDRDYERWAELQDRQAAGGLLSADERAFCAAMSERHPLCAREEAMLDALANLDGEPEPGARAREDAVLAALWNEGTLETMHDDARVSREIAVPPPRRRTRMAITWAAAAGVALAVGTGIARMQQTQVAQVNEPQPSRVELVYASGDVRVDARVANFGQLLSEGSTVQVHEGAACLAIDPGIDVCLSRNSTLRVTRTKVADRRVDLLEGTATSAIDPQPTGARFSIVAHDVWSTAVGTAFSVSATKDGHVDTVVLSGKVLVGSEGRQRPVSAHQRAKVAADKPEVKDIARSEEAPYWAAIKTTDLWRDPQTATLSVTDGGEHATVWLDGSEIGSSPLSSLIPAGEHRVRCVFGDGTSVERTAVIATGKRWSVDLEAERQDLRAQERFRAQVVEAAPLLAPKRPATSEATTPPASELLARARQQLRQREWTAAAETYRQIRSLHPQSAEAQTVLVSLAQLSLEHLDQPSVALAHLDEYLTQGGGALSQEARYLRIDALRALGKDNVAYDAARAFLDDYPTSFQAGALRQKLRLDAASAPAPTATY